MDILLITIGSHGDVHPFIGIGRALTARGHRVRVGTNEYFATLVERAGLEFLQLGDSQTFARWLADPLVWHPHRGPGRVMAGIAETLGQVYDFTARHATPDTLVVGSTLALGALTAAEKLRLRYATAHLGPICVRSYIDLPTLPGGMNFSRFPRWFRKRFWEGADRWFIDPTIAPALNDLRQRVGLAPVSHVLEWWNAQRLTIGLWPEWFSRIAPDHPPQLRLTGFPLYDEADHHEALEPELDAWLSDGEAPIAFTPGSAMKHGARFFEVAAEACDRLDRRGLLLTRHIEQVPGKLPPMVRHLRYAPFSQLLPRCAALVHHGGIGSTAQALRAGIPQLIMAMSHDQPDNAARVKRLGCGDVISREFFWPGRVGRKLQRLTTDPLIRRSCSETADRFRGDDSMLRTVELIESLSN